MSVSLHRDVTSRQTYSLLEWLADIGGLYDALKIISGALVAPLSSFALKAELLTQIFRIDKSQNTEKGSSTVERIDE